MWPRENFGKKNSKKKTLHTCGKFYITETTKLQNRENEAIFLVTFEQGHVSSLFQIILRI